MTSSRGDDRKSRWPYAKGLSGRREILDRTLDVIAEQGRDATSLRAIAQAIGIDHSALRHYFGTREKLLLEVPRERDLRGSTLINAATPIFDDLVSIVRYTRRHRGW